MATVLHDHLPGTGDPDRVQAEFRSLVSGCGIYELASRVKYALTGKDRVRWLNGMVTNNIRDLAPGRGVYAFLLTPQGHILGDLYAYNRGESLELDVDQAQTEKLLTTLRRYIIMDKVELADSSNQLMAVGICGPKAEATLRAVGIEFSSLGPLELFDLSWGQTPVTIVRGDNSAVSRFELWVRPEHAAVLHHALLEAGGTPVSEPALELLRIAAGIPHYGKDIRERDLPQETNQDRALNFTKGCYIGQEIVERIRSRGAVHRQFTGFLVEGNLPADGAKIQVEGKDVGEVTSVAALPLASGALAVALGYLRREALQPGKLLQAGDAKLSVSEIPFTEAFKN